MTTTPGRLVLSAIDPVFSANGTLANGATLNFYQTGTTTNATFYTDNTLVTPVLNPQISNAGGRFYAQTTAFWSDASVAYDFLLSLPDGEVYSYAGVYLEAPPVDTSGFLKNPNVMLTGVPTAPTPAANDSSSKIATTAFVQAALSLLSIFPSGMIVNFGMNALPAGWLLCDGTSYLQGAYPALFGAIGTTYGSVDSTHFNVPNLLGRFARGANPGGTGPGPTTPIGTATADALQGFLMAAPVSGTSGSFTDGFLTRIASYPSGGTVSSISLGAGGWDVFNKTGALITDGTNGTPRIANETRPSFLAVNYGIRT